MGDQSFEMKFRPPVPLKEGGYPGFNPAKNYMPSCEGVLKSRGR
jgi:hypothetical protein